MSLHVGLVHIPNSHSCIGVVVHMATTSSSRHARSCASNPTHCCDHRKSCRVKAVLEKSCCTRPPLEYISFTCAKCRHTHTLQKLYSATALHSALQILQPLQYTRFLYSSTSSYRVTVYMYNPLSLYNTPHPSECASTVLSSQYVTHN